MKLFIMPLLLCLYSGQGKIQQKVLQAMKNLKIYTLGLKSY